MKEFFEFIQSIKYHVSIVIVIWLALRAWVAIVKMRIEYGLATRGRPMPTPDPEFYDVGDGPADAKPEPRAHRGTRPAVPASTERRLGSGRR